MRIATVIGVLCVLGCLVVVGLVLAGLAPPTTLVALGFLVIGAVFAFVMRHVLKGWLRTGSLIRELPDRGLRRRGKVRDVLANAPYHGGASFRQGGALMVMQVDLEPYGDRPAETVRIYVVEPTEDARARIGTHVTVLEHPDDSGLRALEGRQPNGTRLGANPLL